MAAERIRCFFFFQNTRLIYALKIPSFYTVITKREEAIFIFEFIYSTTQLIFYPTICLHDLTFQRLVNKI